MKSDLELLVVDLSRGGAGVARGPDGSVVFIPWTAPGDRVRVRITEKKKRFLQAELLEVLVASPLRQQPPCAVFGRCGGCQWQHLPYQLQWETKVKGVGHALRRAGIAEQQNWEEIPADQIWGYRNRVQLRGRAEQLGFFKRLSQELVAINHCAIARPEINEALEETHLEAKRLGMSRPGAAGSAHYKVELEVLANGQLRRTWNAKHSENGFRQVHDAQNLKLQEWIDQQAPDSPVLYDLYGGSGNLSLRLAKKMQEIHCVDLAAPIDRPVGTPDHFHFHRKAVLPWLMKAAHAQTLPGDFQSGGQPGGTAILDPSREGLGGDWQEIAQCLQRFKVSHLFQVGCDPDSWARDVSRWIKGGWIPRKWMVIDLFPQTAHVECVAFLTRQ